MMSSTSRRSFPWRLGTSSTRLRFSSRKRRQSTQDTGKPEIYLTTGQYKDRASDIWYQQGRHPRRGFRNPYPPHMAGLSPIHDRSPRTGQALHDIQDDHRTMPRPSIAIRPRQRAHSRAKPLYRPHDHPQRHPNGSQLQDHRSFRLVQQHSPRGPRVYHVPHGCDILRPRTARAALLKPEQHPLVAEQLVTLHVPAAAPVDRAHFRDPGNHPLDRCAGAVY